MNAVTNQKKFFSNALLCGFYGIVIIVIGLIGLYTCNSRYEFDVLNNEIFMLFDESHQVQIIPAKNKIVNYYDYKYISKDTNVAVVTESGFIEAVGVGTTEIEIISKRGFAKEKIIVNVKEKEIETIDFNGNIVLKKDETIKCYPVVNGDSSILSDLTYKSDNVDIAVVDQKGIVKALNYGTTRIYAVASNGVTGSFEVTVVKEKIDEKSIELNQTSVTLDIGNSFTLNAKVLPDDATNKNVTWTSSDTNIITVNSNGILLAKKSGTAIITAETINGKTATCKVIVKEPTVSSPSITLNKTSLSMNVGNIYSLVATVLPENTTNKSVAWTSSDQNIITVNNGTVTAKREGTATITAKLSNGKTATCKVIVKEPTVSSPSITLNKTSLSMNVGNTYNLVATVLPENTTNKSVTWTSSDQNIITVNNGTVTAKGEGTATITAKLSNGKTATCKVTVTNKVILPTSVNLNITNATIKIGETLKIVATISPSSASNQTITWTSSDQSIATVNNGIVTAKKEGTVIITATSSNGKTNKCKITVSPPSNTTEMCEYIKLSNKNKITYDDFKKVINNSDDYYVIKAAHDCANKLNLPVSATKNGIYNIYKKNSNDSPVVVKTSTDLNNATIYIHDENGVIGTSEDREAIFSIENPEKTIKLDNPKIYSLKGNVKTNVKRINALAGYGNILVEVINDNKKQFIRSGSNQNQGDSQTEVFKVDNNGNLLNDIIWNYNDITKVNISKIPTTTLTFKNGNFVTIASTTAGVNSRTNYAFRGIAVKRSKTTLNNINHTVVNINKVKLHSIDYTYYGFIQMNLVSDISISDCNLYALKTTKVSPNSTYDFIIDKSVNLNINNVKIPENQLSGSYWGVIATNYVKDITFNNCRLNRIDSHKGANNLTISNTVIGDKGLTLIGGGKLRISNTTVSGTPQFINLRSDYGSLWNGSIEISNSTFIPNTTTPSLISMQVAFDNNLIHNFGYDLVIPNVTVTNFAIQKLVANFPIYDNSKTGLLNGNLSLANNYTGGKFKFTIPSSIKYSNITSSSGNVVVSNYKKAF